MQPSLFISHGSPMLALQPGASGPALARLACELKRPDAIVVVSAHWESEALRVMSSSRPETWHDFGGFPAELYQVQYRRLAAQNWPNPSCSTCGRPAWTHRPMSAGPSTMAAGFHCRCSTPTPIFRWCRFPCPAGRARACKYG